MASYIKRKSKKVKALGVKRNYSYNRTTGKTTRSTTTGLNAGNVRRTYIQSSDGKSKIRTTTRGVDGYVKVETKTLNAPKPPKPQKFKQTNYKPKKVSVPKTKKIRNKKPKPIKTFRSHSNRTYSGPVSFTTNEKTFLKVAAFIILTVLFGILFLIPFSLWYGIRALLRYNKERKMIADIREYNYNRVDINSKT